MSVKLDQLLDQMTIFNTEYAECFVVEKYQKNIPKLKYSFEIVFFNTFLSINVYRPTVYNADVTVLPVRSIV